MDADARPVELARRAARRTPRAGRSPSSSSTPASGVGLRRHRRAVAADESLRLAQRRPQALQDRPLPQQREALRLEARRTAGEPLVHLGGALAEEAVTAAITASSGAESGSDTSRSTSRVSRSWLHSHRSASLGDGVVDDDGAGRGVAAELHVERPGDTGHVVEPAPTEVHRQRDVGVLAGGQLADQLGDHPAADDRRGVGLLGIDECTSCGSVASRVRPGRRGWPVAVEERPRRLRRRSAEPATTAGPFGQRHGIDDGAVVERWR